MSLNNVNIVCEHGSSTEKGWSHIKMTDKACLTPVPEVGKKNYLNMTPFKENSYSHTDLVANILPTNFLIFL